MAGALVGPIVGTVVSGIMGGGGGGGGGGGPPPASGVTNNYYGQLPGQSGVGNLLQTLISGGGLLGIGPMSSASLQQAAGMADPFAGQRAQYQSPMQGVVQNLSTLSIDTPASYMNWFNQLAPQMIPQEQTVGGLAGTTGAATLDPRIIGAAGMAAMDPRVAGMAGTAATDPRVSRMAGTAQMAPLLQAMGTADPSMAFRYQTGLDAVTRGAAATGMLGSGAMATQLEQYGQGFASQEYQNMFNRQMNLQQLMNATQAQNFGQLATTQQETAAIQAQNFGQLATTQQEAAAIQAQNFGQLSAAQQLSTGVQQQNWQQQYNLQSLYGQQAQQQFMQNLMTAQAGQGMQQQQYGQTLGLGNLLGALSGATTGSPSQAASIMAGKYGQSQDTIANFLRGISTMFPGSLGNMTPGPTPSFGSNPLSAAGNTIAGGLNNAFSGMTYGGASPYSITPAPGYGMGGANTFGYTDTSVGGGYYGMQPPSSGYFAPSGYTPTSDYTSGADYSFGGSGYSNWGGTP